MKCVILAGGFATRLWPLTENKAKPLLHLKDKPLISHIVEKLPEETEIIISTNAVFEEAFNKWVKELKEDDPHKKRRIKIFVEDSDSNEGKKGALGATALVIEKEQINEDLMLIAGDNYFGFEWKDLASHFKGNPLLAAYDIGDKAKAKKFGVVVEKEGRAIEFQEKPEHPKSTLVSTGCFIFPAKNLKDILYYAQQKKDDLGGIFEYLLSQKERIDIFHFKEAWVDIGSYEAYLEANKDLLGEQLIEQKGVQKEGLNEFQGGVYLGKNVCIRDSIIENSVILDNCKIDNCVIRNCIIDEN